jgi:hypothetical protein
MGLGGKLDTLALPDPGPVHWPLLHPNLASARWDDDHTASGPPYLCCTQCGVSNSATELRNVPSAHLATGQTQAVPIYRSGTQGRSIISNDECYYLLLLVLHGY